VNVERTGADTPCRQVYLDHTAAFVPPRQVLEAAGEYLREVGEVGTKDFALVLRRARGDARGGGEAHQRAGSVVSRALCKRIRRD